MGYKVVCENKEAAQKLNEYFKLVFELQMVLTSDKDPKKIEKLAYKICSIGGDYLVYTAEALNAES